MASGEEGVPGFLTETQRMVLSAALEERDALRGEVRAVDPKEPTGPRPHIEHATKHPPAARAHHRAVAQKQERRSHQVTNGRPKKAGGGGKGTWGDPLDLHNYEHEMDPGDPLYESDEDDEPMHVALPTPVAHTVEDYKRKVVALLEEFFSSGDISAAAQDLKDLAQEHYHHHVVKRMVTMSLDRHDRHKEMAAQLLSALYAAVIAPDQLAKGFKNLLESVEDLEIDCPGAGDVLATFLARSVVDDVLPPAFLKRMAKKLETGEGAGAGGAAGAEDGDGEGEAGAGQAAGGTGGRALEVVRAAEGKLASAHHAEVLEKCWGGSARVTYEGAKGSIKQLLAEYVVSGERGEACRCIRELNLPFFHHEVVKAALIMAMENKPKEAALLSLLQEAAQEGLISASQVSKGFGRVFQNIDDLALDVPSAPDDLQRMVAHATSHGWLSAAFADGVWADLVAAEASVTNETSKVLQDFKSRSSLIVAEYFESGDVMEVTRSLEELAYPDLHHHLVKRLVTMAMDRNNREREMASQLLSALFQDVLPTDQVEMGFLRLLEAVDDLALDIPDAATQLALFISRAVIDDVLAPHFVLGLPGNAPPVVAADTAAADTTSAPPAEATAAADAGADATPAGPTAPAAAEEPEEAALGGGPALAAVAASSLAREVVHMSQALITARHAGERLLRCWGGSAAVGRSVADAKESIVSLLSEYVAGGELSEACRCIRELNLPFFHHEIVKQALVRGMEEPRHEPRVLLLLQEASDEALISTNQMARGFQRVADALPDLVLDIPNAVPQFAALAETAKSRAWIPADFAYKAELPGGDVVAGAQEGKEGAVSEPAAA
ncbi:hypothetical protein CLOM_g23763 [Closterium sp. NIES-68]|nr:hypothetical protein CLOM_g23763 [Closterium sp. NIES-68]GJP70786.1 hypothetical protein CLOP_g1689 [Closterium sp. NIES-67]